MKFEFMVMRAIFMFMAENVNESLIFQRNDIYLVESE